MLEARGLFKSFGKIAAVRGVSFTARDGQITGLLGPNGAGKSTTLRMLYTVLKPDAGDAFIDGKSVTADPLAARRAIGVLSHGAGVYNNLTARENIAYFGELHGMSRAERAARAAELIEMLEMQPFADRLAKGFSQGQKLKTALARALVHRPRNVLLDEPTNGLDVMAVRNLRKLLGQLRDAGHCVLFSSHVMQEVEQLCDEVVVINGGQVVAAGALADIRAMPPTASSKTPSWASCTATTVEPNEPARHLGGIPQGVPREPARQAHACCRRWCSGRSSAPSWSRGWCNSASRTRRRSPTRTSRGGVAFGECAQPHRLPERARRRHREGGSRRGRRTPGRRHADAQDHPGDSRGFRRAAAGGRSRRR